jgi:hypothetical protein
MSAIKTTIKVESIMMDPRVSDSSVWWVEKDINPTLYYCSECQLLWSRKWHAEKCGQRNHITSFPQHYGGVNENGVYKPRATYMRHSYGRFKKVA